MENNRKDQKFNQTPGKKSETPVRGKKREISSGTKKPARPEIDLPLKGGRSDVDLSTKTQPKRDDTKREDKNDYQKSSR
jgi:hypothetical protein